MAADNVDCLLVVHQRMMKQDNVHTNTKSVQCISIV